MKRNEMTFAKMLGMGCLLLSTTLMMTGCSDSDTPDVNTPDQPTISTGDSDPAYAALAHSNSILFDNGQQIGNGDGEFCFTGKQTIKKGTYILKGWVYVRPGAELTIEPGTVIRGDKETKAALIIEPGAKIHAQGTADAPIVFTSEQKAGSRKPGDWGGVIICGKAPNNNGVMAQQIEGGPKTKHGGKDANDNSGEFEYVRIEYAGYPFQKDKEINGLTLGSVGAGTKLNHIQVSYSNDDSYEWFGGTVNCDHLIAYKTWDDDFDTDNGFSGHVQFGLSYRDSKIADTSMSNSFESDNNANGDETTPYTTVQFSNMTLVGPKANDANFQNTKDYINGNGEDPKNGASLGLFQSAMQIRRSSQLKVYNSVAYGWPVGLILDGEKGNTRTLAEAGKAAAQIRNVIFANMTNEGSDKNKSVDAGSDVLWDWKAQAADKSKPSFSHTWFESEKSNKYIANQSDLRLTDIGALKNVAPDAGSMLLSGADFTGLNGFQTVNYLGAFSGANDTWMNGWTNFDPQQATYSDTYGEGK